MNGHPSFFSTRLQKMENLPKDRIAEVLARFWAGSGYAA